VPREARASSVLFLGEVRSRAPAVVGIRRYIVGLIVRRALALAFLLPFAAAGADRVGVEDAVEVALQRNASLLSLQAEVAAARARLAGASLLVQENPELDLAAGPRWNGGGRSTDYQIGISQRLEPYGQRGLRTEAGRQLVGAAEARLEMRRVEVAAEVRTAFYRALAAGEQARLATQAVELADEALKAADARQGSGAASTIEVNTARIALGRSLRERSDAEQRRTRAIGALLVLLGLDARDSFTLKGKLDPSEAEAVDGDALMRAAVERRADLAAARRELEAARAEERLAGREALPNPRVGVSYAEEERAQVLRGGVAIALPFVQRNQAGRGVASARVEQSTRAAEALERTIRAEVMVAVERLRTAAAAAKAFGGEAITSAHENLQLVTEAYRAGKVDLFQLLVIRREALDARTGYLSALEELAAAEAEVKRVGGSVR
jgi:cobalt-zinc-cadmium efflux system outer membrane protein